VLGARCEVRGAGAPGAGAPGAGAQGATCSEHPNKWPDSPNDQM